MSPAVQAPRVIKAQLKRSYEQISNSHHMSWKFAHEKVILAFR